MFSNGPLDFFYAAHNQMASTVMNMTISLTLGTKSINSNMPEAFTPGQCRSARMECVREEEGRMPKAEGGKDIKRRTRVTRVASGGSGVALGGCPAARATASSATPQCIPRPWIGRPPSPKSSPKAAYRMSRQWSAGPGLASTGHPQREEQAHLPGFVRLADAERVFEEGGGVEASRAREVLAGPCERTAAGPRKGLRAPGGCIGR